MDSIKITFFGIGCCIIKGHFDELTWQKFKESAKTIKYPLEDAFFEKAFFKEIKIKEFKKWNDLGNVFRFSGLLNSYQSVIEIKINNKRKAKISFQELFNERFLFPLYNTTLNKIDSLKNAPLCLTIVEKEIGTIATYKFETENFSFDKIHFTLNSLSIRNDLQFLILSKIEYDGKELCSVKSDTLVRERFALV